MRTFIAFISMALAGSGTGWALTQCYITASNQTVRNEGLTERLADIQISCVGGAPFQAVAGNLQASISSRTFTNRDNGDGTMDLGLSQLIGGNYVRVANSALRITANLVTFINLNLNFDAQGNLGLRIENIRSLGQSTVLGAVSWNGTPTLLVATPYVQLSEPAPSLLAGYSYALAEYSGELPAALDFSTLVSLGLPHITTRLTEGLASAFAVKGLGDDNGTRFIVRYTNMPSPGRILVPEFIIGSPTGTPTSAGDFGYLPTPGVYQERPGGVLVLGRVHGSDINGAGGPTPIFGGVPGAVADADSYPNFFQAVYEVIESNPSTLETALVPAFLWIPPGTLVSGLVRQAVTYGPISDVAQSSTTAPIPRFEPVVPPSDCQSIGDCNAYYFPQMTVTPVTSLDLTSPQNSGPQSAFFTVKNTGGSVLEWSTEINYLDGNGWMNILPSAGFNDATVAIYVTPGTLPYGKYRAQVTVSAVSPVPSVSMLVTMSVTLPLPPPPPPAPKITGVLNAASMLPLPIAPGSLAVLTGGDFVGGTTVTVAGFDAPVLGGNLKQIIILVPSGLAEGKVPIIATDAGGASIPYYEDITEVAPAVFGVLNVDNTLNADGNPARTGDYIQVFGTGIPDSSRPWFAHFHDRWIYSPDYAGPSPGSPGLLQFNFRVPSDLPTMQTEVQICGTPTVRPDQPVCSLGFKVWIVNVGQ